MFDNARLLDLIERTLDSDPICPACGAPTTIEQAGGSLWIVCSAAGAPTGLLQRLGAVLLPHRRRVVVNLVDDLAA